jgi:hypothetical protein
MSRTPPPTSSACCIFIGTEIAKKKGEGKEKREKEEKK